MNTRKENFEDKRNEMKNSVLNDCKEDLILISKYIQRIYKRYHSKGKYLIIVLKDDCIRINNAYYGEDEDFPIDICFKEGRD